MTIPALLISGAAREAVPQILLLLVFVLLGAKLVGALVERLGQPAVIGELLVGILLGNMALVGGPNLQMLQDSEAFLVLAELGAVLLLFQVGLESTPREMMAVGGRAFVVACVGVVTPMALGFGVGRLFHPDESWMFHAFLGSILAATSVGITARVLSDLNALKTRAAHIILGAAVIDDVLGLIVLAVVAGIITAAGTGQQLGSPAIVWICVKAVLFLAGALVIGGFLSPRIFRGALPFRSVGLVQSLSLSFCFALSYLALRSGLAPIVGAFAAGLVLEEAHFEDHIRHGDRSLHRSLEPLTALLVPIFFVRLGMLVNISSFAHRDRFGFALALTAVAIAGKLVCGLVVPRGVSRLAVGIGMMPRGEVGLIIASMGTQLVLDGRSIVDSATYAAAIFMVIATTMLTPPLLVWVTRGDRDARLG